MASQSPLGPQPLPAPADDDDATNDDSAIVSARPALTAPIVVAVGIALLLGWAVHGYVIQNSPHPLPMGPIIAQPVPADGDNADTADTKSDAADDNSDQNADGNSSPAKTAGGRGGQRAHRARSSTGAIITVQVAGHVRQPGLYQVRADCRVGELINTAGGIAADGDEQNINLAARLKDGQRVDVPAAAIAVQPPLTQPTNPTGASLPPAPGRVRGAALPEAALPTYPSPQPAGPALPADSATAPAAITKTGKRSVADLTSNPVDIGTASADELSALPGIGPGMAARIVDYRTRNGGFHNANDLDNVPGMGAHRMQILLPLITLH